jgi:MerR family copper efflux transcriptional regulator
MSDMDRYRISELAREAGVNPRTIDFYTNQGLLEPVERSEGGHRFYGVDAPQRIRAIKALKSEGLLLQEIKHQLSTSGAATETLEHAEKVRKELESLERQISGLGKDIARMPLNSDARAAAERALHASMVCALALAHKAATLLAETQIQIAL